MLRSLSPLLALALVACAAPAIMPVHESAFTLFAPQFPDNTRLETRHAGNIASNPNCVGQNVSPALAWKNVPAGTKSLAIVMHDPEGRGGTGVYHWIAYGIDPALGGFAENEVTRPSPKFTGGKSTQDLAHYMGPCPVPNTGWHHYTFTAIATDYEPGALPAGLTWPELQARLAGGHGKVASSMVLRFGRP
ncbi:YbhB/YbcL family Raf kinase inhibitor-like protein [Ramlibacter sp. XY19]|uniref:YbhB/YbcL family Raf kinase inhibitor-like protein n=1 Tax=Ramlibacter paludis TaxID=2908000 RepID=UPI0023DCE409|nr:YbhB/YbcL family Raf kinase inhibitor-like protein [Ramlibacter paludis]MCG2592203.1 YbhB/YbcL family Raf kinase inhibitor-like protein [Ramlibacter paludis]